MNDRGLLELAAKAAGGISSDGLGHCYDLEREKAWNPLVDDGDAARLANKLSMDILHNWESVTTQWQLGRFYREKCTDETRDEATRRAITRAAAELGKAMP